MSTQEKIKKSETPPRDLPDWLLNTGAAWTSSRGYQGCRELFSSLESQSNLNRAFPRLRLVPYFDRTYRGQVKQDQNDIPDDIQDVTKAEYHYSPISGRSIRLLHVEPGIRQDPISCHLAVHGLGELPSFDALSYTWGNTNIVKTILCDGQLLKVHMNAWSALLDLRQEAAPITMWIDAICINQADMDERSAQVQLMRDIYMKASHVAVWMRPTTADTSPVFQTLASLSHLGMTEDSTSPEAPLTSDDLGRRGLPKASDPVWKELDSLLWNQWFSRTWIIQEISLARKAMLVCGANTCPWEGVTMAADYIRSHSLTAVVNVDPSQVLRLTSLAEKFRGGAPILELAQLARASKATNPRDKIYGLLGLASDAQNVTPDYSIRPRQAYLDLAISAIKQTSSLGILNYVDHWGYFTQARDPMASWIPNWTLSGLSQPLPETARIDSGNTFVYDFVPEQILLVVQGIEVTTVKDAGDTFLEYIPSIGNSVPGHTGVNWATEGYQKKRWRQWNHMATKVRSYPTGEDVWSAYIRTLVADSLPKEKQQSTPVELKTLFDSWVKFWRIVGVKRGRFLDFYESIASPEEAKDATLFMAAHQAAAYGRRFFVTQDGYFGLGPFQTRSSDRVVALCGGKTPYVLRQCTGKKGGKEWRVIGECYIYGISKDVLNIHTTYETFSLC
ncbi:heterokaryon incompatibility protein-domain-containing protein [Whalleya microplaca]|nr:heterokaryon incompatibility protein-domain-containing protein [Whalleya microplaca]